MKRFLIFFLITLPSFFLAQNDLDLIRSVQLHPTGNEIGYPILSLQQQKNPLRLKFDYIGDDAPYFTYKIEHYSANWEKSPLSPLQYIKGFSSGDISDFEFSLNTRTLYTHYEFEFPNTNLKFLVSGNYKLLIYGKDSQEPLIEKKFMVSEQVVTITGGVENATAIGQLQCAQQLDFAVSYEGLSVNAPREEFQANIFQNMRPDNAIIDLKPNRFQENQLIFNQPFKQQFMAGNEFRWFNTRSIRYKRQHVAEIIERKDSTFHVYLKPDVPRKEQRFFMYNDYNGQFKIEHQEGRDPNLTAEYVYVHFTLDEKPELKGKDIYVYGALTDWSIQKKYKLQYNPKQDLLEAVLPLKQGNYDYMYVYKTNDGYSSDYTEGNFYRTGNKYLVFIYYKPFGARYDRLVGVRGLDARLN